MQFLEIFGDFGILGFSKILGFFQRFFGIFDEVYEDFQSNLPLGLGYLHIDFQLKSVDILILTISYAYVQFVIQMI
jgi:hypothetical protein